MFERQLATLAIKKEENGKLSSYSMRTTAIVDTTVVMKWNVYGDIE